MLPNKQTKLNLAILLMAAALCMAGAVYAAPMGTAFTYQGRLADANSPAEGLYDFEFEIYDALDGDSQQGSTLSEDDLDVIDGYFTVPLDFGTGVFTGDARWLQIAVRLGASTEDFTTLSPRQELTPAPYALYAEVAATDNDWRVSGDNMFAIPGGTVNISRSYSAPAPALKIKRSQTFPLIVSTWMDINTTSIDTYWRSFQTTGTALKLNSNSTGAVLLAEGGGNVGIGTNSPQAKLHIAGTPDVDGIMFPDNTLQTTAASGGALVPIGAVIDWWRPNDTFPIPDGYKLCAGFVVNDPQSPFNGETLPDLRNRFVRGAGSTSAIGWTGGTWDHTHSISGSTKSKVVTMGWSDHNAVASLSLGPLWEFAQSDHVHTTNSHSHGSGTLANSNTSHIPPYVGLLKIMRIR